MQTPAVGMAAPDADSYGHPMASSADPRAALRAAFRGPVVRPTMYFLSNWVAALLIFVPLVVGLALGTGLLVLLPLAIPVIAGTLLWSRAGGAYERLALATFLDLDLASPHSRPDGGPLRRMRRRATAGSTWREIGYHLLQLPASAIAVALVTAAWAAPLAALTAPLWVWLLPHDRLDLTPGVHLHGWLGAAFGVVAGVVLLPLAPLLVRALADLQCRLAAALLGPSSERALGERVTKLEQSRSAVVEAAEAERRRIERDLHDGAQQRLVALAMDLGMARQKLADDPSGAATLLDEAHQEAKLALAELRDLARGIHPAVLADRGLGAALSAVAARSPIPVTVVVEVPQRPDHAVEGIAYFLVSEALANVAKHARATRASVSVVRRGGTLVVEVTDDGQGGADPSRGTGLAGLRDRVGGVDGWFHLSSPPGGPTTLLAELPCAS